MEHTTVTTRVIHRPKAPAIKEESSPSVRFDDPALRIHSESLPLPKPQAPVRAAVTVSTVDKQVVRMSSPQINNKRKSPLSPSDSADTTPCNSPTNVPPEKPLRASQKGKAPSQKGKAPSPPQKTPSFDHCPVENMPLPVRNARVIPPSDVSNITTHKKTKKTSSPLLRKKDKAKHPSSDSSTKSKKSFFKKTKTPKSFANSSKDSGIVSEYETASSVGINSCEDDFSMTDDTVSSKDVTLSVSSVDTFQSVSSVDTTSSSGALVSKSAVDLTAPTAPIAAGVKGRAVNSAVHGARLTSRPAPTGLNTRNVQGMFPQVDKEEARPRFAQHNRVGSMDDMDKYLKTKPKDEEDSDVVSVKDRIAMYKDSDVVRVKDRIAMYKDKDSRSKTESAVISGEVSATKRKVAVNSKLSKSIEQDTKRLNTQRPKPVIDSDSKPPRARVTKKKSLRARMSGSKQEKRRLEKAQQIQRDKSMLEEQMYEFERR